MPFHSTETVSNPAIKAGAQRRTDVCLNPHPLTHQPLSYPCFPVLPLLPLHSSQTTDKQARDLTEAGQPLPKALPSMYETISSDEEAVLKTMMQVSGGGGAGQRWGQHMVSAGD